MTAASVSPRLLGAALLPGCSARGSHPRQAPWAMIQRHQLDEAGYRGERFAAFGRDLGQ